LKINWPLNVKHFRVATFINNWLLGPIKTDKAFTFNVFFKNLLQHVYLWMHNLGLLAMCQGLASMLNLAIDGLIANL
jgi:hypothetical protein